MDSGTFELKMRQFNPALEITISIFVHPMAMMTLMVMIAMTAMMV